MSSPQPKPTFVVQRDRLESPQLRRKVANLFRGWSATQPRSSRRCRCADLHAFAAFALEEKVPPPQERDNVRAGTVLLGVIVDDQTHVAISEYIGHLQHSAYACETIQRRIRSLRNWADYLAERDAIPQDAAPILVPPASRLRHRCSMTGTAPSHEDGDVESLSPDAQQFIQNRNQTLVDLRQYAALDRTRLLDLNWNGVDFIDRRTSSEDPPSLARVIVARRDGRERWHRLGHHATRSLLGWAKTYTRRFGGRLPDRPVFVSLSGDRLSPSRLYQIVDA